MSFTAPDRVNAPLASLIGLSRPSQVVQSNLYNNIKGTVEPFLPLIWSSYMVNLYLKYKEEKCSWERKVCPLYSHTGLL